MKENYPSRKDLDQAFHNLHDQITRITVEEEKEMVKTEMENGNGEMVIGENE